MTNKNALVIIPTEEVANKLQEVVFSVTGKEGLSGFNKAFLMASGIAQLKELLTPEYMAPIMQLQGSKLGFRTDKDKTGGYSMDVVKDCIIEAVLNGLEVTGNQFNIIAGNCYPTKEGCGAKLNKFPGLKYQIIAGLPRINDQNTSAAVDLKIKWTINAESFEETVPKPIRVNNGMGLDAIIGKAERKGRAWLLGRVTGTEIIDAEVEDAEAKVVGTKLGNKNTKSDEEHEIERNIALFNDCTTVEELEFYKDIIQPETKDAYEKKHLELSTAKKK